ncbi:MAG: hypothetical protein KDA25_10905 [Phycisphaerales bacterium]|nr:hypothetical protein [Phycisphaerales bacterium]
MACNIDARGRVVRLVTGLVTLALGVVAMLVAWLAAWDHVAITVGGIVLCVFGAFGVIQGWAGWCAVRALGFRTRL